MNSKDMKSKKYIYNKIQKIHLKKLEKKAKNYAFQKIKNEKTKNCIFQKMKKSKIFKIFIK